MLSALLAGVAAGLAVAVPLGAIGVMIVELGARAGFRAGWRAGLGTALCDGLYALGAVLAGGAAARALSGIEHGLTLVAAAVLAAVAVHLLLSARRTSTAASHAVAARAPRHVTLRFLALTAINPLTLAIFAGLIAGDPDLAPGAAGGAAFVAGVLAASLAWQSTLAGTGALLHHRLPPSAHRWTQAVGGALVLALAVRTALG
ncbi:MAG TPA: LysE family transporter [Capillimicrobium sp.]|nr:LysE family transporter [Capillimicrobium sp.]